MPFSSSSDNERERWNRKYREASGTGKWIDPDPFLLRAFSEYIRPLFPHGGSALDLAGGAGRHAIWLAKQGWEVTLIDISETGVEQARQLAGPLASHIRFVVDDLTHFKASQMQFEVVMAFFYLAWRFQLEGQKLKGILLLHLVLACLSTVIIWLVWWVHFRVRRRAESLPNYRLALEILGVGIITLTGHLGGFLSGVNGPG